MSTKFPITIFAISAFALSGRAAVALWARERAMSAFSDEKQNNLKYMNDFQTLL